MESTTNTVIANLKKIYGIVYLNLRVISVANSIINYTIDTIFHFNINDI